VSEYAKKSKTATYHEGKRPWCVVEEIDLAFPCATQNEVDDVAAKELVKRGCKGLFEGANMPSTPEAVEILESGNIVFGPAKAANAGGVAVSGLEMAQNAQMVSWSAECVEGKLNDIMKDIYSQCAECAKQYWEPENLKAGANIAAFLKVAAALREQGAV